MIHIFQAVPKWRPIQAFIALTDTLNADEGGFEAAPGLHLAFDDWVANRPPSVQQGSSSDGNDIMTSPPWYVVFECGIVIVSVNADLHFIQCRRFYSDKTKRRQICVGYD